METGVLLNMSQLKSLSHFLKKVYWSLERSIYYAELNSAGFQTLDGPVLEFVLEMAFHICFPGEMNTNAVVAQSCPHPRSGQATY